MYTSGASATWKKLPLGSIRGFRVNFAEFPTLAFARVPTIFGNSHAARRTMVLAHSSAISGDKLICLGKNYLEHAKELGDAVPDKPLLFLKPPSAAVVATSQHDRVTVRIPRDRGSVHYEAEMLLRLDENLQVDAVSLGLDLTLRDLQAKLKKDGHPWEVAKAFPDSAVIGPWINVATFSDYVDTEFSFELDGAVKQRGAARQMTYSITESLRYLKENFRLIPGDVIFTGTPKGVGPVTAGQIGRLRWGDKLSFEVLFT